MTRDPLAAAPPHARQPLRALVALLVLGLAVHIASAYAQVGLRQGSPAEDWLQIVIIACGGVLCGLRARWVATSRWAWASIGLGLVSFALGNVAATVLRAFGEVAIPSVADAFWLGFYVFQWVGFGLLVRGQAVRFYRSMWLDGLIGILGGGAFMLAVVLGPLLRSTHGTVAEVATTLAYPLSDVLLLGVVVGVATLTGGHPGRSWLLLGLGLGIFVVADSLYLPQTIDGSYVDGGPLDSMWATAAILIGLAAWSPVGRREVRLDGWRAVVVPAAFGLLALGLLVYGNLAEVNLGATILAAGALLCAGGRAALTFRETRLLAETRREALTDELTGLPNRRRLRRALGAAVAAGEPARALVLFDLDRFKELNDTLGHGAGDQLLQAVARRLATAVPEGGLVARPGSDEFAALVSVADRSAALALAERLRAALLEPIELDDISLIVAASVGVALIPDDGDDADRLLQRADVAMQDARARGVGCSLYDPQRDSHSRRRLALAGELRDGIPRGELVLHYQPKVDLRTGAVVGVEALVRWQHPRDGLLAPDAFLAIAEQAGLMRSLSRWVLGEAIAQTARWHAAGHPLSVAVNLSPQELIDTELPAVLAGTLERHGLDPAFLQIEITEQTLMTDPERTGAVLTRCGELGIGRSLDDFGTGFSSLAYLQRLHVDELKVDRGFVAAMGEDEASATIVRSVLELARSLGLRTVAEGVETAAMRDQLARLGCDQYQGFLLSRPLPVVRMDAWLEAARPAPALPGAGAAQSRLAFARVATSTASRVPLRGGA